MPINPVRVAAKVVPTERVDESAVFRDAVALKRSGDLKGALAQLDRAVAGGSTWGPLLQARAGYVALDGDLARAKQLMAAVPPPPETAPGELNGARVDFSINLAWFSAIVGDDAAVAGHLRDAIELGGGGRMRAFVQDYVASEPDLARLRDTPEVKAALAGTPAALAAEPAASVERGNPNERGAASDFAATAATPKRGASPLETRIAASTGSKSTRGSSANAALKALAAQLPSAEDTGAPGAALASSLRDAVLRARADGEESAFIDTNDLDGVLTAAFDNRVSGMNGVTKALKGLGYDVGYSAFASSLTIQVPGTAASPDGAGLLEGLRALKPPAGEAATGVATAVADLVRAKIDKASGAGETRANLETGELDRALRGLDDAAGAYGAIAKQLKKKGFDAFADGFIGVSFSWSLAGGAPDAKQALADFKTAMPTADALLGASGGLVDVVKQKIKSAAANGETSADLETNELDRLLKGTGLEYDDVAKALEQAGFRAGADGFVGVSFDWS